MEKLSYNDKLRMQTLWQVSHCLVSQNGRTSAVDSTADFLNDAQISPFVR